MKDKRTFKYRFLLALCRLFKLQRVMELPPEKAKKLFAKAYKGVQIPKMSDPDFDIDTRSVMGSTCIFYKHKAKCRKAGIYLIGGGMLKYPKPSQAREDLRIAKTTGRDFVLPFYPLVHTGNTLPDVYKMIFELYKQLLREYEPENICILGGYVILVLIFILIAKLTGEWGITGSLESLLETTFFIPAYLYWHKAEKVGG